MANSIELSICILTRDQPHLLPICVASCIGEIERAEISAEIVIIDNASIDAYPQRLAHLSSMIRILRHQENLGFSAANNKAIRMSQGRFILILNDDAILQPGSLELMLHRLRSSPSVAAVGPKLLNPDGSLQRNFTNRRSPSLRGILCQLLFVEKMLERNAWTRDLFTMSRDLERSGETDHIAGACFLAKREALEAVGLFDENFYYLYEDGDLCYRLKDAGWQVVYLAEARVTHVGSASLQKLKWPDRNAMAFKSMIYYFQKHSNWARRSLIRLTLALVLLLRLPVTVLRRMWVARSPRLGLRDSIRGSLRAVRVLLLEWD